MIRLPTKSTRTNTHVPNSTRFRSPMNITRPERGHEPQSRRRANLQRLLSPRHVAFVGGQSVVDPIKLCRRAGFAGEIWAVNPRHAELAGAPRSEEHTSELKALMLISYAVFCLQKNTNMRP